MTGPDARPAIDAYNPAFDSEPCMALERLTPQGEKYRLSFRRSTFHRRAENFEDHKLLVARADGEIVGVTGVAFKDVRLLGESRRAAFYFDMRVHPRFRRRGVALRLAREILKIGEAGSDIGYCYIIGDNQRAKALTWFRAREPSASCRILVYPTYRRRASRVEPKAASMADVHQRLLAAAPAFDFYTNPLAGGNTSGRVASWITPEAGCTVWSNEGIMAEVVEALPVWMRSARLILESWPLRAIPHPHLPELGEQLRSWYLTDVFGRDPSMVADLVSFVSDRARDAGVDFLYIPWVEGDEWIRAVKADVPWPFAAELPYLLFAADKKRPLPQLRRIYLDVRDV